MSTIQHVTATLISGVHPDFMPAVGKHACDLFKTDQVHVITRPYLDVALTRTECRLSRQQLFDLRVFAEEKAREVAPRYSVNRCLIMVWVRHAEDDPEFAQCAENVFEAFLEVRDWGKFDQIVVECLTSDARFVRLGKVDYRRYHEYRRRMEQCAS